jgi:hypothetical protein
VWYAVIAIKSREVVNKKEYSERHQLGYAIYNVAVVSAIIVPVLFVVTALPEARFVLQAVSIFWGKSRQQPGFAFLLWLIVFAHRLGVMVTLLCLLLP